MKNQLSKVTLTLLVVLAFMSCEKGSKGNGKVNGEDLLAYAPKNSNVLVYANVKDLKSAEILKGEVDEYKTKYHKDVDAEFKQFLDMTGFDPATDVDEVMVAGNGFDNKDSFVFAAKGNFPSSKLISYIESKKNDEKFELVKMDHNGQTIYHFKGMKHKTMKHRGKEMSHERSDAYVAFVNDKLMIAGAEYAVKSALDGKSSVKENAVFMAKVKEFAYNDVYTVMNTENVVEQMNANIPAPIKHNVELIKSVAFGFSADKSLVFSLVGECLEAVDAQNLRDAVQGLVAMARLGVSGERDLIDFMNEVEVTNEDKKIMINLEVSQERLNKLKSYKDKMKEKFSRAKI